MLGELGAQLDNLVLEPLGTLTLLAAHGLRNSGDRLQTTQLFRLRLETINELNKHPGRGRPEGGTFPVRHCPRGSLASNDARDGFMGVVDPAGWMD